MSATARLRPAGPPAASVRPGSGGVGRSTSAAAERVSDDLRRGSGDFLEQRRWIAGLGTLAAGALGVVALYQFGLLRRVPEPPLPLLHAAADAVDASGEACQAFKTSDAALGLVSAGATLVLAGIGDRQRARTTPWVPLALAAKTAVDTAGSGFLLDEQLTKLAQVATLPLALPEARVALHTWRCRR